MRTIASTMPVYGRRSRASAAEDADAAALAADAAAAAETEPEAAVAAAAAEAEEDAAENRACERDDIDADVDVNETGSSGRIVADERWRADAVDDNDEEDDNAAKGNEERDEANERTVGVNADVLTALLAMPHGASCGFNDDNGHDDDDKAWVENRALPPLAAPPPGTPVAGR